MPSTAIGWASAGFAIGELEQRHGPSMVTDYTRTAVTRQMVRLARAGGCTAERLLSNALKIVHL